MKSTRRLWQWLAAIFLLSFGVLGWMGHEIYLAAPPIPTRVIEPDGTVLFSEGQVQRGQEAWFAAGGQQLGSVWGHGSYVAPDLSADWLHREAVGLRDLIAQKQFGASFDRLHSDEQAVVAARVKEALRHNTYDAATGTITLSPERATVVRALAQHYMGLFGGDSTQDTLRVQYAMVKNSLKNEQDLRALPAFFFWSAWACATDRPAATHLSYTSNWPHEPLVDNVPTTGNGVWSIASVILLIAGVAAMVAYHSAHKEEEDPVAPRPIRSSPCVRPRLCGPRSSTSMS